MLRIKILSISIIACSFAFGHERSVVTLDDALNIHIYNTRIVQMHRMAYENSILEYKIFEKSLLPSLEFNFSPVYFDHSLKLLQNAVTAAYFNVEEFSNSASSGLKIKQTLGATGGVLSYGSSLRYLREFTTETNSFSTSPFYANYTQQLFGGRKSFRYRKLISQKEYEVALKNYCTAVTEEEQTILNQYFNAYSAKVDKEYYTRICTIGDTLLMHAKLRFMTGKITEYDFNQIELQQMGNSMSLLKANEDYIHAIRLLEAELGLKDIDVAQPYEALFPVSIASDEVMALIKKNNPEYQKNELQRLNAEYSLLNAKISNSFNANISLTYGLNQYARTLSASYIRPNQQQAVSVTLAIPVFEWGANKDRIKIAQNNYETVLLQQEAATEKFEEYTSETVSAYNRSIGMIGIAEKRHVLSKRQYEFAAMRFAMGKMSMVELIAAESEQLRAKQEFMSVQRELYTMYYQIRHQTMYDFIHNKDLVEQIKENGYGKY